MKSKDKFIGFIDILGFKDLVRRAEIDDGVTIPDLSHAMSALGTEKDREAIKLYGPTICPNSMRKQKDVDFQISQVSDCVVVSTEISPAGAITLINHCWIAVFRLLRSGLMCRGHILRGRIFHDGQRFMGTGYQEALEYEKNVGIFKRFEDERGTPFVEVDSSVIDYINDSGDKCILEILPRYIVESKGLYALIPFRRLTDFFDIGSEFDAAAKKNEIDLIRSSISKFKSRLYPYVDIENARAMEKLKHYLSGLESQLNKCDELNEMINYLDLPFPRY